MNTQKIRAIATVHHAVHLNTDTSFNLRIPGGFVPDIIRVSAITNFNIVGIFEVQSNMLSNHTLCVMDAANYNNPVSTHMNTSRDAFDSEYSIQMMNVVTGQPVVSDNWLVLTFEFIRYDD